MIDTFITKIHIDKVRHLTNVDIVLNDTERRHLVLTGRNGSGKTSLLEAMRNSVLIEQRDKFEKTSTISHLKRIKLIHSDGVIERPALDISYSETITNFNDVIFAFIPVVRIKPTEPKSIEPAEIQAKTFISNHIIEDFFKYILILYVQYLSLKDSGGSEDEIDKYNKWFDNFKNALREIYDCQQLELKPDIKNLAFQVILPGHEPFGLNEMSDGYASFIYIYMEMLMRMESSDALVDYGKPGIVLIDEIETHLHVEMQKMVLPFLTKAFPNVQFIVATHSPFVITSLNNAVVFDLEKKETLDDPSLYSYETVVESFLDTSAYSQEMRRYFDRYKELCFNERTPEENEEFLRAKTKLELMSPASKELYFAFNDLEAKRKATKNG
jgi:AAA15 family ATPase/GTPase